MNTNFNLSLQTPNFDTRLQIYTFNLAYTYKFWHILSSEDIILKIHNKKTVELISRVISKDKSVI